MVCRGNAATLPPAHSARADLLGGVYDPFDCAGISTVSATARVGGYARLGIADKSSGSASLRSSNPPMQRRESGGRIEPCPLKDSDPTVHLILDPVLNPS
jgi:hypothetical protein